MATETKHYTKEQVTSHLLDALWVVADADVPTDLRPIAFQLAVNLLAQKTIMQPASGIPMLGRHG